MKYLSIIKVPVLPATRDLFLTIFKEKLIDGRIDLRKMNNDIGLIIKSFLIEKIEKHENYSIKKGTPYLSFILSYSLRSYGLNENKSKKIGHILDIMAKRELCKTTSLFASLPEISVSEAIRLSFDFYGVSIDYYDHSHFRRYYDQFNYKLIGLSKKAHEKRISLFLMNFYLTKVRSLKSGENIDQEINKVMQQINQLNTRK